ASVLGIRRRGAGAVSRRRSGRRARHRHWLLLRRSRPSGARSRRSFISKFVSLHDWRAGRRSAPDHRTGLSLGKVVESAQKWQFVQNAESIGGAACKICVLVAEMTRQIVTDRRRPLEG